MLSSAALIAAVAFAGRGGNCAFHRDLLDARREGPDPSSQGSLSGVVEVSDERVTDKPS